MAIRKILTKEDEVLNKVCKPVEKFDKKLWQLLDDMADTLYKVRGVGLAAPQIGILRRVAIVDVGDGLIELINPTITNTSGEQRAVEGCLSCPEQWGYVTRPMNCTLKSQDRNGEFYEMDLTEMACRCACHEVDHLDGNLFLRLVDEFIDIEDEE
ncbi:MAG TPA: peptide deformylase [Clostridiales bacterium]|nr:peptide deformylase [Clostridiales bacterium]